MGISNYYIFYTLLCLYLSICALEHDLTAKVLFSYLFIYLSIAALNISSYRGNISTDTLVVYFVYVVVCSIPLFFNANNKTNVLLLQKPVQFREIGILYISIHLLVVYIVLIYLIATKGNILINQYLRLSIPPWSGYVIRSSLVIPVIVYSALQNRFRNLSIIISLISILPSIIIGARGSVIVFVLAAFFCSFAVKRSFNPNSSLQKRKLINFKSLFILTIIFVIIVSGFYIRRWRSDVWASPSELVKEYFQYEEWWVYLVMPFYLAFRETLGITDTIIRKDLQNESSSYLFVSEVLTLLPGEQVSPGSYLGDLIGRVGDEGLTPGIFGGLFLDFGFYGGFVLLLLFYVSTKIMALVRMKAYYLPLYMVFLFQLVHLFHRGFIKPEYITYIMITIFYCRFTLKHSK